MKDKYFCRQVLFIINQLAILIYFVFLAKHDIKLPHNAWIQLGITTLLLFDACYVSYKNIRNNTTLSKFALLLTLVTWYFLFGLSFNTYPVSEIYKILLPLVLFQTLSFTLTFLFQESKYKYRNIIYIVMSVICGMAILFKFISEKVFNFCLLMQFVVTAFIIIVIAAVHRKRMIFILKTQRVQILMSFVFVLVPFFLYSLYFLNNAPQLENIGTYMICSLCFVSIHSIIFYTGQENKKCLALACIPNMTLAVLALLFAIVFGKLFQLSVIAIFVLIYAAQMIIQIYNLFLYLQTRRRVKSGQNEYHDFYSYSLSGIRSEETLKREISEFLHDNVLQDLLSVKILVNKSEKPEVKLLMSNTLEQLSHKVRSQMEQYHPVILKSLTLKENYKNLIKTTSKIFPLSNTEIVFLCHDDILLADPYPVIIYRMMKELITNSLKHSAAKMITVNLSLKREMITLEVSDNGIGFDVENCNVGWNKGLVSVCDMVHSLDGNIQLNSKVGEGAEIIITMPMKGERSYESFISR